MSLNPYNNHYNNNSSSQAGSSTSSSPDVNAYDRQQRSHWSVEDGTSGTGGARNFVEKSSSPSLHKGYEPSIRSTNSDARGFQGWKQERQGSVQYSDPGSLPSYHDSPSTSKPDLEMAHSIRARLDAEGNRARLYLFLGMTSCMMLIFLITALIWLKLGLIKKPLQYGLDNKGDFTVRTETVN